MKKVLLISALLIFSLLFCETVDAQCAMCKAVVESGSRTGSEIAGGINNGILYLMGVPYLMVFVIGFVWYKKYYKTDETK